MGQVIRFPSLQDALRHFRKRHGAPHTPRKLVPFERIVREGIVIVRIPLILRPETNMRISWRQRVRKARLERETVRRDLGQAGGKLELPALVILTRFGRELDDDNLVTCFKHVRDGVADWMGLSDRNPVVSWRYRQVIGEVFGFEVKIERRT